MSLVLLLILSLQHYLILIECRKYLYNPSNKCDKPQISNRNTKQTKIEMTCLPCQIKSKTEQNFATKQRLRNNTTETKKTKKTLETHAE